MATATIELPKNDNLTLTFLLQDAAGAAVDFDAASLTAKGAGAPNYTLAGVKGATGVATFTIPAHAIGTAGTYFAAVAATKGDPVTEQHTLAFLLRVTDHP